MQLDAEAGLQPRYKVFLQLRLPGNGVNTVVPLKVRTMTDANPTTMANHHWLPMTPWMEHAQAVKVARAIAALMKIEADA